MATLVMNNSDKTWESLSNGSCTYPFQENSITYPSVHHYIYTHLTNNKFNPSLLAIQNNDTTLRQQFNQDSSQQFQHYIRNITNKTISQQLLDTKNTSLKTFLEENVLRYYYYITNDNLYLGINEDGYGFNLLGQAYSRMLSYQNTSFYNTNEVTVHRIYKASMLCVEALKNGMDISIFVGKHIDEIIASLSTLNIGEMDSSYVYKLYKQDPFYMCIQYEIDYPLNLAGFIRQKYATSINYYLRQTFNDIILSKYFEYLLSTKFSDIIDNTQMSYYVTKQKNMLKADYNKYVNMIDRLYEIYNDPGTTEKASKFLTNSVRQELYDIEIRFLNANQLDLVLRYVPFLYNTKLDHTMYIYDDHNKNSELQPNTSFLSPLNHSGFIIQDIFSYLGHELTNLSLFKCRNIFQGCGEYMNCYMDKLNQMVNAYKHLLMKKGMVLKFKQNIFARYLLYNTNQFGYNLQYTDLDPIFNKHLISELLEIRRSLDTKDIYQIVYALNGKDVHVEDRISFRLYDLQNTLDAYRLFMNKSHLTLQDYTLINQKLLRNVESTDSPVNKPMHPSFFQFFERICERSLIKNLWSFFSLYSELTQVFVENGAIIQFEQTPKSISSIVAYFITTFYNHGKEQEFYHFILQVILGKPFPFVQSMSYYSTELENEFCRLIPIDDYDPQFIINMMGVTSIILRHPNPTRILYFSYWALPIRDEMYPCSLSKKMIVLRRVDIEDDEQPKRRRKKKTMTELRNEMRQRQQQQPTTTGQETQQEEEYDMNEMYEELGIDDDNDD